LKVELTFSLNISLDFIKHFLAHVCMGIKSKRLSIYENLNIVNKVDGVLNVPHTKIAEELGISVSEVTGIMLV
jgi:hypothetical protein